MSAFNFRRSRKRDSLAAVAACWLAFAPASAHGQEEPAPADDEQQSEASRLFSEAVVQERLAQFAQAAQLFGQADELAPNAAYLERAIRAAVEAQEPTMALRFADRARFHASTPGLAEAVQLAMDKYGDSAAKILIQCQGCYVQVNGVARDSGKEIIVPVGQHTIVATQGPLEERWSISLAPGEHKELVPKWIESESEPTFDEPDDYLLDDRSTGAGVAPVWFFAAAGATVFVGGLTIASAIDSQALGGQYDRDPTFQRDLDARRAEYRTFILLATTGAALLGTATIGVLATDWELLERGGDAWLGLGPTGVVGGTTF